MGICSEESYRKFIAAVVTLFYISYIFYNTVTFRIQAVTYNTYIGFLSQYTANSIYILDKESKKIYTAQLPAGDLPLLSGFSLHFPRLTVPTSPSLPVR